MKLPYIVIMILSMAGYTLMIYSGWSHQVNPWTMWIAAIVCVLLFVYAGFELTRPQY